MEAIVFERDIDEYVIQLGIIDAKPYGGVRSLNGQH